MAHMFASLPFLAVYFDDHVCGDDDPHKLLEKLTSYLDVCQHYNIKLSKKKIKIGFPEINALGFIINKEGYFPRSTQINRFLEAPFPVREQLKSWFGLLNVFRDFLPDMTEVEAAFAPVRKNILRG